MGLFATYDEQLAHIRKRFNEQVAAADALLVIYDNAPGQPPSDASEWLRVTLLGGDGRQVQFGSGQRFRRTGVMVVQVFTPLQTGDRRASRIAHKIQQRFSSVSIGRGVVFLSANTETIGRSGQYWQVNVNCPFRLDNVRLAGEVSGA